MVYRLIQGAVSGILTAHFFKVNETYRDLHALRRMQAALGAHLALGLRAARDLDSSTV